MARDYTALPHEYLEEMEELTDEEYGRLIRALQKYSISGIIPDFESNEKYYLRRVINREDRYKEQFDDIDRKLKEKAKKAIQTRWDRERASKENTQEYTSIHTNTQVYPSTDENTCDTKTKTETKTKTNNISTIVDISDRPKPEDVVDLFHKTCTKLAKVKLLTPARQTAINARLKESGLDAVKDVFTKAQQSDFLTGTNDRGWKADFDWLLKPANFAKVMEGNYTNRGPARSHGFEQREIDFEADEAMYMTTHLRGER